jgi:predicted Zn-dependent protease
MRILLTLALALFLTACETIETTQPGAVGIERQQQMMVSSKEIDQAAAQEYRKVIAQAQQKGTLDRNAQHLQRVRTVLNRIIPQTRVFRPDAPGWAWEVHVIQDNQLNAWAMPGGKMVVYSGLIEKLHLTDDELAAIMGHEIAHSLREHAREQVSQALCWGWARSASSLRVWWRTWRSTSRIHAPTRWKRTGSGSSWPRGPAMTRTPQSVCGRRCCRMPAAADRSFSPLIPRRRTASPI